MGVLEDLETTLRLFRRLLPTFFGGDVPDAARPPRVKNASSRKVGVDHGTRRLA